MDRICSRTVQVLWPSDCLAAVVSARMDVPMREPDAARPARRAANPHAPTHAIKLPPMRSLALGIGICAKGAARTGGGGVADSPRQLARRGALGRNDRGGVALPHPLRQTAKTWGFYREHDAVSRPVAPSMAPPAAEMQGVVTEDIRWEGSLFPAGESADWFSSLNQTKSRGPLGFTLALLRGCKQNRLCGIFFSPS